MSEARGNAAGCAHGCPYQSTIIPHALSDNGKAYSCPHKHTDSSHIDANRLANRERCAAI